MTSFNSWSPGWRRCADVERAIISQSNGQPPVRFIVNWTLGNEPNEIWIKVKMTSIMYFGYVSCFVQVSILRSFCWWSARREILPHWWLFQITFRQPQSNRSIASWRLLHRQNFDLMSNSLKTHMFIFLLISVPSQRIFAHTTTAVQNSVVFGYFVFEW